MTNRFISPEQQFISNAGQPYAGGFLYFYLSGTSTPTPTYQDQGLTTPNTNPVVLDSAGNAGNIFLNSSITYKVVLTDSNNNTIWTFDPVIPTDAPSNPAINAVISCTPSNGPNAITLTAISSSQQPAAYSNYTIFGFVPSVTTTGAVTIQVGSLAFYPLFLGSGVQANANDLVAGGGPYFIAYGSIVAGATPGFLLLNPTSTSSAVAINSATTISNTHNNKILQLGGGGFYTVTFPIGSSLASNFKCTIVNEETSAIGKGISGIANANNGLNWTIYPGQSYEVFNDGGTIRVVGNFKRYKQASVALFVDTANGSDDPTVADGLAVGTRAYKTIGHAVNSLYQNFDHNQSQPTITVAAGTYNESIVMSGMPVGCANVFFINGASPGVVTWQPAGAGTPYCMIVGDGAIIEYSNIIANGNSISGSVFLQLHQQAIADQNGGMVFGAFPSGSHLATDGSGWTLNINASYSFNGGSTGNHLSINSPGIVNHAGSVTITINSTPTLSFYYRLQAGGIINLGSSITFSGSFQTGCQKWAVNPASALFCGGNSASIPGSVAGNPATGSSPSASTGWAVA
jgi:hypothetical protein